MTRQELIDLLRTTFTTGTTYEALADVLIAAGVEIDPEPPVTITIPRAEAEFWATDLPMFCGKPSAVAVACREALGMEP